MGRSDTLQFNKTGFSASKVLVNGRERSFAEYIREKNLDTKLPLVADYCGVKVNVSVQEIREDEVTFYAPVFKNVSYKHAAPISDYVSLFEQNMRKEKDNRILFSCNCILNYLYSELEGKKTGDITGPITFGEIAYQLLNQTCLSIRTGFGAKREG